MLDSPSFLFVTCQVGAEPALKQEMARLWPAFRFAYSRPGFVTFKLPTGGVPPDDLDLGSTFARAYGFSLGKAEGATPAERAQSVWKVLAGRPVERLHVWPRDAHEPGQRGYEPAITPAAQEALTLLQESAPPDFAARLQPSSPSSILPPPSSSLPHALVADIVLVEEHEWWIGYHREHSVESTWPGGLFPETLPPEAVSRVYLKMREAVVWSEFDMKRGDRVAEIGCAPGGASQALLDMGVHVLGIDPAEMPPIVAGHPRFRHIRRRSKEVRRRDFLGVNWLTCDINMPPNYTLDTVEAIVSYPGVKLKGMLLTLKLVEWSLAEQIPSYLARLRAWGFRHIRARQLHHNRQEICVAARK